MPRLIWSHQALSDLSKLHHFLLDHDEALARRAIKTIREGLTRLESHPEAGRKAEGMPTGFREWSIPFGRRGYVALYRQDTKGVVILAVRHAREAGFVRAK